MATTNETGYSIWTAAVFMVSFNAGLGVLALPHSIAGTGWYGLLLILLATLNSIYSALYLGQTWIIMEKRWEEYRGKFRYPYPAMGMKAVSPWMRYIVSGVIALTALGVSVVYLLLSAQVTKSMTESFLPLKYEYWIIILAVVLCPLTWFGSIENFKFAGIGALATIVIASLLLFVSSLWDLKKSNAARYENPTFGSASLSFGTILFGFGGIYFFPTVQNDMRDKLQFKWATLLSYAVVLVLYIPVGIIGYLVYGSNVNANLLLSLEEGHLKKIIEICLAIHTFLALLLAINPVLQETEEVLHIPTNFNYKRCLLRTAMVGLILLIAYTIPHFEKVMNFIGGSTVTLLTFIFPSLFYFRIQSKESKLDGRRKKFSALEGIFLLQIMLVGVVGGISCTYFAVIDIAETFRPKYDNIYLNTTI